MHWSRKRGEVGGEKKRKEGERVVQGEERGGGGELGQLWFVPIFGLQECIGQERGGKLGGRGKEGGMKREVEGWREIGATVAFFAILSLQECIGQEKGREVRGGKCREGGDWRGIGATVVSRGACNPVITVTNPGPPMVVDNRII